MSRPANVAPGDSRCNNSLSSTTARSAPPASATAGASSPLSGPMITPSPPATSIGNGPACRADARVDDRQHDPGGHVRDRSGERQRTAADVEGRDPVREVDDLDVRGEIAHDGLHHADELVVRAEVGEERDRVVPACHRCEPIDRAPASAEVDGAAGLRETDAMVTHDVLNQATPFEGANPAALDVALLEAVARHGGSWGLDELVAFGQRAGDPEVIRWAELANAHPPVLHTHDRFGHRVDDVEFHPAYHRLMRESIGAGLHASPWQHGSAGAHVVRAAKFSLWSQVEQGHLCPISMTYSIIPAMRTSPDVAAAWEPLLTSRHYDRRQQPAATKTGATAGMAMTEKQGGSDVRANTTRAEPAGDDRYLLTGHKWFCSAPMSDVFLMLAQAPGGLSCFAVPRWLPDGERNAIEIERLKDKLGNRSNASSEIEIDHAQAQRIGDEGAGIATILQMVNHTRLDCVLGVTGQMRAGFTQAAHHASGRAAFGRLLIDQPLMRVVLADLAAGERGGDGDRAASRRGLRPWPDRRR